MKQNYYRLCYQCQLNCECTMQGQGLGDCKDQCVCDNFPDVPRCSDSGGPGGGNNNGNGNNNNNNNNNNGGDDATTEPAATEPTTTVPILTDICRDVEPQCLQDECDMNGPSCIG